MIHTIICEYALAHLSYEARLASVAFYCAITSLLLYSQRSKPPGWSRLPVAVLVAVFNFIVPALFHPNLEICTLAVLGLNVMWLSTFKAVGWAFGRGPLIQPLTLPQFMATLSLPITPVTTKQPSNTPRRPGNARQSEASDKTLGAAFDFALKLIVLAAVLTALQSPTLPRLGRELLYALGLYLFIGIIMQCVAVFTIGFLGMPVAPHFDRPFLSSSFTDFWSRRWNLNTGYTMRFMVYDPICDGQLIAPGKQHAPGGKEKGGRTTTKNSTTTNGTNSTPTIARRAAAVCTSFFVSGIMHEVFIIFLRNRISWFWLAFFSLQGPIVVLESVGRARLRSLGVSIPSLVAVPLTLAALLLLGDVLFFPDIVRMNIPQQVCANLFAAVPKGGAWQAVAAR